MERVVLKRLNKHMEENNLLCSSQHGYKKYHSTETLMLGVMNDLLIGFDSRKATVMILIDLSAAFDTVDLDRFIDILKFEIGICGVVLVWFRSFLVGRTQRVMIDGSLSEGLLALFGVPQGSVLGPVLFNIYTRTLANVIQDSGFRSGGYADDNNATKSFALCFQYNIFTRDIPNLMQNIANWMNQYFLKLNPDKTELMVFNPKTIDTLHVIKGVILPERSCIRLSKTAKNLGIIFDAHTSI